MAQTPLGQWKLVRNMGSSSQRGLIIAPGQEAKKDIFSIFLNVNVYYVFSLESSHWDHSNEYTQYTIFKIKKKKITLNYPKSATMGICS